jgi:catechol 2,3-dioxygenase-like lactoylglutathione lyase family enzyme
MSFNHAMIWVSDVKRSQAFYAQLGARVVTDVGHCSRLAFANGNTLSLHVGETKPGTTALFFDVNVDATHTALEKAGFGCTLVPTAQPWAWREAHFNDPDGNPVVIYQDSAENRRLR